MFLQEEPITCADQKRECAVVVNISSSHPGWVAINPCLVKWEADEWHQTKRIEVTAVQDYVHTNEDRQVQLKTQVTGTTSELYQGFDPADIYIELVSQGPQFAVPACNMDASHFTTTNGELDVMKGMELLGESCGTACIASTPFAWRPCGVAVPLEHPRAAVF